MLAFGNQRDKRINVARVGTEAPFGDLPVENVAGDVRVIGRNLTPALASVISGDPHKPDKLVAESLKTFDFHASPVLAPMTSPRSARRARSCIRWAAASSRRLATS